MSIATTELRTTEAGFPAAATDGIPHIPDEVIAETGDDSTQIDSPAEGDVAVAEAEPQDSPADSELRAQIEAELRASLSAELGETHKRQIAELQRVKDREIDTVREQLFSVQAREPVLINEFLQILQAYGINPQDAAPNLELAVARVDKAQQASVRQAQQSITASEQIAVSLDERFKQRNEDAVAQGLPALDPLDPEVRQARAWFHSVSQQHFLGSERARQNAERNLPIAPSDMKSYREMDAAIRWMNEFESKHRATLAAKAKAAEDARKATTQKAAATRQANRGAQHIATGAGAGPMSEDAAWEAAVKEFPDDYEQRFKRYLALKTPR